MSKPCPLPPNPLETVHFSPSDQVRLVEALLDESTEPAPAMERAANHYKRLIDWPDDPLALMRDFDGASPH